MGAVSSIEATDVSCLKPQQTFGSAGVRRQFLSLVIPVKQNLISLTAIFNAASVTFGSSPAFLTLTFDSERPPLADILPNLHSNTKDAQK